MILAYHIPPIQYNAGGTDGIWSDGCCVSTVGLNETMIKHYSENQGKEDAGQAELELQ